MSSPQLGATRAVTGIFGLEDSFRPEGCSDRCLPVRTVSYSVLLDRVQGRGHPAGLVAALRTAHRGGLTLEETVAQTPLPQACLQPKEGPFPVSEKICAGFHLYNVRRTDRELADPLPVTDPRYRAKQGEGPIVSPGQALAQSSDLRSWL